MNLYLPARFDIIKSNFVIEFGGKPMKYRQWNLRPAHPAVRYGDGITRIEMCPFAEDILIVAQL